MPSFLHSLFLHGAAQAAKHAGQDRREKEATHSLAGMDRQLPSAANVTQAMALSLSHLSSSGIRLLSH